jgi:hypothetical protein
MISQREKIEQWVRLSRKLFQWHALFRGAIFYNLTQNLLASLDIADIHDLLDWSSGL